MSVCPSVGLGDLQLNHKKMVVVAYVPYVTKYVNALISIYICIMKIKSKSDSSCQTDPKVLEHQIGCLILAPDSVIVWKIRKFHVPK